MASGDINRYDAIVLAGGRGSRFGGLDKAALTVGDTALLDYVLAAVATAEHRVVVGPERPPTRGPAEQRTVCWCHEDPAGSGPVAALAAGLAHTTAGQIVVLAVDLPFIAPAVPVLLNRLRAGSAPVALLADQSSRLNYLAAAWQRPALVQALAALGSPIGASMRALFGSLEATVVVDPNDWGADCDTVADLDRARRRAEGTR